MKARSKDRLAPASLPTTRALPRDVSAETSNAFSGDPGTSELAAAIASLATTAATFTAQVQRVAELLSADNGSSTGALALLAKPEAVMTTVTPDTKQMLTQKEAADMIRIHHRTLQRMRASREGPKAIKIAGALRYRRQDVERWLEGKRS